MGPKQQRQDHLRLVDAILVAGLPQETAGFPGAADALPGGVDAFEEILLDGIPGDMAEECRGVAFTLGRAHALAAVHAARQPAQLGVGAAQHRIVQAGVDADAVGALGLLLFVPGREQRWAPVKPFRPPGLEALANLLGKAIGIGGGLEDLGSELPHSRVMTVAAGGVGGEARDDDVGLKAADDANHVAQDALPPPFCERLLGRFAVAEVDGAREELLAAVEASGCQQFLRANDAQVFRLLGPDQVLAALAARGREVGRAQTPSAGKVGDHCFAFVVGVRSEHEEAAESVETIEGLFQLGRSGNDTLLRGHGQGESHSEDRQQRETEMQGGKPMYGGQVLLAYHLCSHPIFLLTIVS